MTISTLAETIEFVLDTSKPLPSEPPEGIRFDLMADHSPSGAIVAASES